MLPNTQFKYLGSPKIDGATINNVCNIHRSNIENIVRTLLLQKRSITKSTIRESAYNGKLYKIIVNIKIKYNGANTFTFITMLVEDLTTNQSNYNRSGLSIEEIEANNVFNRFYPKDSDKGFIEYKDLYRNSQINSNYSFQKTYQGLNVSQSQYIFGSQFTGAMAKQVQYLLGSNDMDIKYRFDFLQSNGIYIDTFGDYWLITIGIDGKNLLTSNGVWCRKLTLINRVDDTVKNKNGVSQAVINLKLIDGEGFLDTDTKILNLGDMYGTNNSINSFPLSLNQGWAFNAQGNKARNVIYSSYDKFYIYEITISEIKDSQGFVTGLSANSTLIEQGETIYHSYMTILQSRFKEYSACYPQGMSIANYNQSKKGPLVKLTFPNQNAFSYFSPGNLSNSFNNTNEYKMPLITFYDENDNPKTYYYYFKATKNTQEIISTSGFISTDDFYKGAGIIEGDLIIKNQNESSKSGYSVKHGIMINDDESNLIIDNTGDFEQKYSFKINTGDFIDTFINQVENNTLPVDLRPYTTFYLNDLNSYIQNIQSNTNVYEEQYKSMNVFGVYAPSSGNTNAQLEIADYFDIKTQLENINNWLNMVDTQNSMIRLNPVTALKDITKVFTKEVVLPDYPPLLYQVNNDINVIFDNLNETFQSTVNTTLIDINDKINNELLVNADWYKRNILIKFKPFFVEVQKNSDYNTINKTTLQQLLAGINTVIEEINTIHDSINSIIDSINNDIASINTYFSSVNILSENCKDFFAFCDTLKGYKGLKLTQKAIVKTSSNVQDIYYMAEKYFSGKYTSENNIKNAQYTHFANIFNYSSRNDLTVYNQKNTFNNNYDNSGTQIKTYTGNYFGLYKKTQTFTNSDMTTLVEETDYIFVEEVANYKRYHFTDYIGNDIVVDIGYNYLDDGYTGLRYLTPSQSNIHTLIQSDFVDIPKTNNGIPVSNYLQNNKVTSYDINYSASIKVFAKEIVSIDTNIINDFRLITFPSYLIGKDSIYYDYFNKDKYHFYYKGDGLSYFNFGRDVYTFNYTMSNGIQSYTEDNMILTNISKYNIINNKFVNYFGKPID